MSSGNARGTRASAETSEPSLHTEVTKRTSESALQSVTVMELKRLISQFTYKIEPMPEGGFVAHASDPSVPPVEAATREELQQKIRANMATALATEFPGLKLPQENKGLKFDFHVGHKPGGGFILESTDGKELPVVGGTHAEIENKFAEKILGALSKGLMPELSKALAERAGSGDVKAVVNREAGFSINSSKASSTGIIQADKAQAADLLNRANSPITPEANKLWPFIRFLIAAIIFAVIIFFVRYR